MKKTLMSKIYSFIVSPDYRFVFFADHGLHTSMKDEEFIRKMYKAKFGRYPRLENPITFTEKLQWLKLHDQRPEYTSLVDKYEVKQFVAERIGSQYVIPILGVWNKFEDIDFDSLPEQFVLKTTHDSGGVVICKDKRSFDLKLARKVINKSLNTSFYALYREWPYKNVIPRIIAEKYMEDSTTKELRDYKFFCFEGKVKALYIASDRQKSGEETKFDFYDENYNHLPFLNGHPNAAIPPVKPSGFEDMKILAEKLSYGFPHVRVDLYEVDGSIYFGELTFCHMSGFAPFEPEEWDERFGTWLNLPLKSE